MLANCKYTDGLKRTSTRYSLKNKQLLTQDKNKNISKTNNFLSFKITQKSNKY